MLQSHLQKLPDLDYRIPVWQPFPSEVRLCPFCGERAEPLFLRPDDLPVSSCCRCRSFYVSLRVADETLRHFYDRYWSETCPRPLTEEMARYLVSSAKKKAAGDPLLRKITALCGSLDGRRVLDVGCGFGEKAVMLKELGASVTGLDVAPEAVRFVKEKLGIESYLSTVEAFSGQENCFDLVTMFDFIEHPLEPLRALEAAISKMKSDGFLLILTPNGTDGEGWTEGQDGWTGFRADLEHMQYLHVETAVFLAHKLGCRLVHLEQFGFRAPDNISTPEKGTAACRPRTYRRLLKNIPGVRQAVYAFRDLQTRLRVAISPPQDSGTYHLFVVLQKTG